jgi:hypothetical protein
LRGGEVDPQGLAGDSELLMGTMHVEFEGVNTALQREGPVAVLTVLPSTAMVEVRSDELVSGLTWGGGVGRHDRMVKKRGENVVLRATRVIQ